MTTATETSTIYSLDDVSKHNTKDDLWMTIHNKVYNITEFVLEVSVRTCACGQLTHLRLYLAPWR